jgi:FkbM family methyltransferase
MHPLVSVLQLPFNLIPPTAQVPVLFGPLRGARWIVGSGNHVCWLGLYEYRKQLALKRMVAPGSVFFDIGAHVGFHSLLASRVVGPAGRVCAFEPFPRNQGYLHEHVRLNAASNVQVIEAAVANRAGVESFAAQGTYMGGLRESGGLSVRTVSIDALLEEGAIPPPDYAKVDVEGGELRVLEGMRATLTTHRPTLFLATHSADLHRDCVRLLVEMGYVVRALGGGDLHLTDELVAEHPGVAQSSRK